MGFMEKMKQKAEEYDLQGKAGQFADAVEKTTKDAVVKAGELAHDNRDKVTSGLDKVGAKIDEQTDGKYHDKVTKAKASVTKGVDKIAEQRAAAPGSPGTPGTPAADEAPSAPPSAPAAESPDLPPVTPQDMPPAPPEDRPI